MIWLPDTCVWIEWLAQSATGQRYQALFFKPEALLLPTVVQFELRRWALRELGDDMADEVMASARAAMVMVLEESIALHAAELNRAHGLAAIDALIYATALHHGARLITCDAHFKGLPQVEYAPKLK